MYEGWAKTPEEATKLLASGAVHFEPNHHYAAVGPMAGTISPSQPLYVVENKTFKNRAYSRPADLAQQFGDYKDLKDNYFWRDVVGPALRKGIKAIGGLPMIPVIQHGFEMGDESHNRNNAMTSIFVNELSIGLLQANVDRDTVLKILKWYAPSTWATGAGVRACLGLALCTAKSMLDPAVGIDYSTVVTVMSRNGTDFGLRVSALGDQWFTAAAPVPDCKYFPPYRAEDSGRDMGDSAISETAGWGCFVLSGALPFLKALPTTPDEVMKICKENQQVTLSRNPKLQIPSFGFQGAPVGIDMRLVLKKGIDIWINTGVAHKDPGHRVIGRGLVRTPREAFTKAMDAYCKKYNVTKDLVLQTAV